MARRTGNARPCERRERPPEVPRTRRRTPARAPGAIRGEGRSPGTPEERFFALAKEATVNGYYTSEIGLMKDLKFKGGTYVAGPETSCPASAAGPHSARPEHGAPNAKAASGHETQKS